MTAPTRGFIFDLDGTLVDTMPSHFVAWTEVARRHGFQFPEERFYALGGVPTQKIAAMLVAETGLTVDPFTLALEKEQSYYDSLAASGGIRPIATVIDIARRHRQGNEGPLAVASGSLRRLITRTLEALGITDWFAAGVAARGPPRPQPEPRGWVGGGGGGGAPPPPQARARRVSRGSPAHRGRPGALHRLRGHGHRP